jgi:AbrB family looped-hinge helix DNA binding protein
MTEPLKMVGYSAKVGSDARIGIPKAARELLNIQEGDRYCVLVNEEGDLIFRKTEKLLERSHRQKTKQDQEVYTRLNEQITKNQVLLLSD